MAFNPNKCLKFTALEDNCRIKISRPDYVWQFSKDGVNWVDMEITINTGEFAYCKGNRFPSKRRDSAYYFEISKKVAVSGSIMSMVDDGDSITSNIPWEYSFACLFVNTPIVSIEPGLLSPKTLSEDCYQQMFQNCQYLTSVPKGVIIETTNIPVRCYSYMFQGCSNLTEIYVPFTDWEHLDKVEMATRDWVQGVSATGTFYCPEGLPEVKDTWHIPPGWDVKHYKLGGPASINFLNKYKVGGRVK